MRTRLAQWALALILMGFFSENAGAAERLILQQGFTQGGLAIGRTEPGAAITIGGRAARVSAEGLFLLGFDRDAPPEVELVATYPDGSRERRTLPVAQREYNIQRIEGLPPHQVAPSAEDWKRIAAEASRMAAARRGGAEKVFFACGFAWPLDGRISGVFGSQRVLNGAPRSPHKGIDIAAPEGTPVAAAADGVVMLADPALFYTGGTVIIDHGLGLSSAYAHLKEVDVREGDRVRIGAIVGTVGRTGRATAPHLHWGVSLGDTALDPELVIAALPAPPRFVMARQPVATAELARESCRR